MSSHNGTKDLAFNLFWSNIDRRSRGGIKDHHLGRGQHPWFDESIQVYREFIQEDERMLLCNLVNHCEGSYGTGTHGAAFNSRQMEEVIKSKAEFYPLMEFLDLATESLKGKAKHSEIEVSVGRRYMTALPPGRFHEATQIDCAAYIVFLNQDYFGGDLWFPTRKEAIAPAAGTLVRFPGGIPYGLNMVHGGYAFTLFGTIQATQADVR